MHPQKLSLQHQAHIIVGTPGRVIKHLKQKSLSLKELDTLVLDEADRMLDMGFIPAVRQIQSALPKVRQTLMFSATFSRPIEALAGEFLHQPKRVSVTPANTAVSRITQKIYPVDKHRKGEMLRHLLRHETSGQVLVFARTKYGSDKLARQLGKAGVKSDSIHGDKKQSARTRALQQFKSGQLQVLVATDIAARGIDIQQLPMVVNFELPHVPEDYVHRIGRTGRAGEEGVAVSLVSAEEVAQLQKIERLIKQSLPRHEIEGFEPEHRLPTKDVASPGKRRPRNKTKAKTHAKPASRNQSRQGKPDHKKGPKAKAATQRPRGAQ